MNKTCNMCKKEKSIEEFQIRKKNKNETILYYPSCKKCLKEHNKQYYIKNKKRILEGQKERQKQNAKNFREYKKTLKCEHCGMNRPECLDFHHKDPKTKKGKVSLICTTSMENTMKEVEKCICVCNNCHVKIHAKLRESENQDSVPSNELGTPHVA